MPAYHVLITGKVQGVYYRKWTVAQAKHLELTGWVRNLKDGRVEAFIQGSEINTKEMIAQFHRGPKHAKVNDVKAIKTDKDLTLKHFRKRDTR